MPATFSGGTRALIRAYPLAPKSHNGHGARFSPSTGSHLELAMTLRSCIQFKLTAIQGSRAASVTTTNNVRRENRNQRRFEAGVIGSSARAARTVWQERPASRQTASTLSVGLCTAANRNHSGSFRHSSRRQDRLEKFAEAPNVPNQSRHHSSRRALRATLARLAGLPAIVVVRREHGKGRL